MKIWLSGGSGRPVGLVLCIALALLASACATQAGAGRVGANGEPLADADRSLDEVVTEVRAAFAEHREQLIELDVRDALAAELEARIAESSDDTLAHARLVQALYAEHEFAPLILTDGRWGESADALTHAFDDAVHHALHGDYPPRTRFIETRSELDRLAVSLDELGSFRGTDEEWAAVLERLEQEDFDPTRPDAVDHLIERLRSPDPALNPLPRLAERLRQLGDLGTTWRALVATTEAELALHAARYAVEMRLGHDANTPRLGLWRELTTRDTRQRARLRAFLGHLAAHGAEAALASVVPPHPQYPLLVEARRRYAGIAAAGGWAEVSVARYDKLRRDRSHDSIPAIKRRLAVEGYYQGAEDDVFDQPLVDALVAYQRTHQLKDDGEIDKKLVDNLNLPVEDRLAKIDVTLQRYRESLLGTFDYYVFVNLPDFYAEVWKGGERRMRFEIVVGKNDLLRDPVSGDVVFDKKTKEPVYANRTPMQTAFLERVIYNPYWNIPPRIRAEEGYDQKLLENPFWLEENGFEMMNPENPKSSWIRQLPGKDNALGRVKFIFPNPHDTYMHDTPQKRLFKHPVRAYSHGCMRVVDPLDFAEFLLREDDQWNASRVERILSDEPLEETVINLRRDVPVHVDYFNTRVDEDGHVHFLSDVYRYDRERVEARARELRAGTTKQAREP